MLPVKVGLSTLGTVLLSLTAGGPSATAQPPPPSPVPITVQVDASEAARRILHTRLSVPVQPGPVKLFFPKWIPGEHAPTGPINSVVNLRFTANGQPVAWRRDPLDMYTLLCDAPAGTASLEVAFDDLVPTQEGGFSSGTSTSATLALLNWNQLVLYPAGAPSDQIAFRASLTLPAGWQIGTALPVEAREGDTVRFRPVSLTTLVDSPVVAGQHYRNVPLTAPGVVPSNEIDVVADSAVALALPDEEVAHYKQLVAEGSALFGTTHYERYHFLVGLSEHIEHSGVEHHESSLNTMPERTFMEKDSRLGWSGLLPHEFVHSWNGKFRRPAGLATPDYQTPMQDDLLWVYEGLTNYLGEVLTTRAGLNSPEYGRENLASTAAAMDNRAGRRWRPLQDTATGAVVLYGAGSEWANLRRSVDFYPEGSLLWLEVDTLIRQRSNGERSLDDFCRAFHGGQSGPPRVVPYTFDDVVNTLNGVVAHDWRGFLRGRLDTPSPHAPLGGIENAGWKLVYTDQPNKDEEYRDTERKTLTLNYSLGLSLKEDGTVIDVVGDGPAFAAGVSPNMKLVAVNGRAWTPKGLKEAMAAGKAAGSAALELLMVNDDYYRTFRVDYHGGERYPHLERVEGKPDLLEAITKARAAAGK